MVKGISKKEKRKISRNLGQAYETKLGKVVEGKQFKNTNCNCKKKCPDKVEIESRRSAFENFWKMGSFSAQNAFICGLIKQETPACRRPRAGDKGPKSSTNHYNLILLNGTSVTVCKKYFLETFQISDGRMSRALQVVKTGQPPGTDKRGKRIPANKIPEERMQAVRQHISSFPAYESHYTRAHNPNRKYLAENLNIRLMYNMYKTFCSENDIEPVAEPIYRRTFNTEFNLHFHAPHKDTCIKCDSYKNQMENTTLTEEQKTSLKIKHELHLRKAESARTNMSADAEKSVKDKEFYAFTFDLEKSLPFQNLRAK